MKFVLHSRSLLSFAINYLEEWLVASRPGLCHGSGAVAGRAWPGEVCIPTCRDRVLSLWHAHLARDSRAGRPCHAPGSDLMPGNFISGLNGAVFGNQAVGRFPQVCRIGTSGVFGARSRLSGVFIKGYRGAKPADEFATTAVGFARGAGGFATTAGDVATTAVESAKAPVSFAEPAGAVSMSAVEVAKATGGFATSAVRSAEAVGAVATTNVACANGFFWSALTCQRFGKRRLVAALHIERTRSLPVLTSY
jgi:hypothetical protein